MSDQLLPRLRRLPAAIALLLAALLAGCSAPQGPKGSIYAPAATGELGSDEVVAVLLPETGRFAEAARAIREGIVAAHESAPQGNRPQLRFFDSSDPQGARALVEQAAAQGAALAIGPLQKEAVERLAASGPLPIPVLALNRTSAPLPPENLYQFALAPEDEAAEAARKAWAAGHRTAMLLYPDRPWGSRMANAFREEWARLGGRIAASQVYDPNASDYVQPVVSAFEEAAGAGGATPARTDVVFLVGTPLAAREMRPQIRLQAGDGVAVFSTSHVYTGEIDPAADAGLMGLQFVDIPWMVAPRPEDGLSRRALQQRLPGMQQSYVRLYAMGIDAFRLGPRLGWLERNPDAAHQGKTGSLTMDAQRRIRRELTLARMGPSGPSLTNARGKPDRAGALPPQAGGPRLASARP